MNTNRINNKNLKRITVAAGTTAAALFLAAGLVACDGKSNETVAEPAKVTNVAEILESAKAEITPVLDELAALQTDTPNVVESKAGTSLKAAPKASKTSKKKTSVVNRETAQAESAPVASSPVTQDTVSDIAQQANATANTMPADQPAVSEPATSTDQPAASAPASDSTSTSGSTGTVMSVWPTITAVPNLTSQIVGSDLSTLTSPSISIPCVPGYTC